jgi:WD40 repeat protein
MPVQQPALELLCSPNPDLSVTWTGVRGGLTQRQNKSWTSSAKFVDSSSMPAEVKVWDIQSRKPVRTLTGHTKTILCLAVSSDGKHLASGSADGTVKLWEVESGKLETNLAGFKGPVTVDHYPGGLGISLTRNSGGNSGWWLLRLRECSCAARVGSGNSVAWHFADQPE